MISILIKKVLKQIIKPITYREFKEFLVNSDHDELQKIVFMELKSDKLISAIGMRQLELYEKCMENYKWIKHE
jgi:hypothetical protein